jgi:hypothetical protein
MSHTQTARAARLRKTAMAVAVLGLLAAHGARSEEFNTATFGTSITRNLSTNSLDLIYAVDNDAPDNSTTAGTLRLSAGVWLTGQNISGVSTEQGLAVFSRQVRDFTNSGSTIDQYSLVNSTLVLEGNNSISGLVGVRVNLDNNGGGNFYGSYVADPIARIDVNGPNVVFNRSLFAQRIDLNQGAAVDFLGQIGDANNNTVLDYKGNNASVTLRGGQTLFGSIVNSTSAVGDKTNGSLILSGSGTVTGSIGSADSGLSLIRLDGSGSTVLFGGSVTADHLDYQASSAVTVQGSLRMNADAAPGARHQVSFNQTDGLLTLVGGDLTGLAGSPVATTSVDGRGTLRFAGTGAVQTVTGDVGAQGLRVARFDVGNVGVENAATVVMDGNLHAVAVSLNNNAVAAHSRLTLASGRSLRADALSTDANGMGELVLSGGVQTVDAPVGAANARLSLVQAGAAGGVATFEAGVFANTVENTATGTSTFRGPVTATAVNVAAGTSTFEQAVSATSVAIGTGSGSFQQSVTTSTLAIGGGSGTFGGAVGAATSVAIGDGTGTFHAAVTSPSTTIARGTGTFNAVTTTNLSFTDAGTAHLNQGLTGTVAFGGHGATVQLGSGKTITGAITTTTANTGVLNARGDGVLRSTVGAAGASIARLNVNTVGQSTPNGLVAEASIWAGQTSLQNGGTLTLNPGVNLTGTDPAIPALVTSADNTGTLRLLGASTVTGRVGAQGAAIGLIDGSTSTAPVTFDGAVVARVIDLGIDNKPANFKGTVQAAELHVGGAPGLPGVAVTLEKSAAIGRLTYRGDGLVRSLQGLTGTVDFNNKWGELRLGDSVNLDTAATPFVNAAEGVLRFEGHSTVTGVLGSAATSSVANPTDRLADVYAGANGKIVTFKNDVRLGGTTLHVEGTGTVNLEGSLYAPLQYDADGLVNVSSGQQIGAATTQAAGTGTLNFIGNATTAAQIGTAASPLKAVNFHGPMADARAAAPSADPATVSIGHSVYSLSTGVGHPAASDPATTLDITRSGLFLGSSLTLGPKVTLNTAGTFARTAISGRDSVTFAHTRNADGSLSANALITRSQTGSGQIATAGATLNVAVNAVPWDAGHGGGRVDPTASSGLTGTSGSSLVMTGAETVNVALLSSLRNGASLSLIDTAINAGPAQTGTLSDNSHVIDTVLSRGVDGDLVLTVSRDANTYVDKSGTLGHISNPAARRLGAMAAAGTGYDVDLQSVLNRLDLDQWGYGSDRDSLAVQVKRLAPIANRSFDRAALNALSIGVDQIATRLKDLRTVEAGPDGRSYGLWVRNGIADARQAGDADSDGFTHAYRGFTLGADSRINPRWLAGTALSYGRTKVEQKGFRQGDAGTIDTVQFTAYSAYDLNENFYADGVLSVARQEVAGLRTAAIDRVASFEYASRRAHALKIGVGYRLPVPQSSVVITPLVTAEEGRSSMAAHSETGAGDIGLAFGERKLRKSEFGVGLRLNATRQVAGFVLRPEVALLRVRDRRAVEPAQVTARYIGDTSGSFATDLSAVTPIGTRLQLGVGVLLSKTGSMTLRYQRDERKLYHSDRADLMLRWDY